MWDVSLFLTVPFLLVIIPSEKPWLVSAVLFFQPFASSLAEPPSLFSLQLSFPPSVPSFLPPFLPYSCCYCLVQALSAHSC